MRSLLFVPADSAKKLDKAMTGGADADSCARKENPCARRALHLGRSHREHRAEGCG
jgi:citrate lyase beta subunit